MSHPEVPVDITRKNGLTEGLGSVIAFLPSITHAVLKFATSDTLQRETARRHAWKGDSGGHGH